MSCARACGVTLPDPVLLVEPCLPLLAPCLQEKRKRGLYRDELGTLQVNIQAAEVRYRLASALDTSPCLICWPVSGRACFRLLLCALPVSVRPCPLCPSSCRVLPRLPALVELSIKSATALSK